MVWRGAVGWLSGKVVAGGSGGGEGEIWGAITGCLVYLMIVCRSCLFTDGYKNVPYLLSIFFFDA